MSLSSAISAGPTMIHKPSFTKTTALICLTPFIFGCFFNAKTVRAEDCLGTLPGADCTLDEDTNGDLTIDNGVTLSIGTSVTLGDSIDGDNNPGDGTISTFGGGTSITQTGDIGGTVAIDELLINDDNTWTTSGAINTDNSGVDINLGVADGGETLNFLNGSSFIGEIDGNALDVVNFGSDGNGGDFQTAGQIESVTLIITSGSLTANDALGTGIALNSLNVDDGASLIMNDSVNIAGALDNDGTINIASNATLSADTYTADVDSGTFVINVARNTGTTEAGVINIANGGPVDFSNDTVQIGLEADSAVLINQTIANIIVGNTAATIAPGQFVDDSFLYDFQLQANGNNFDLVIRVNPLNDVAKGFNNQQVAQILLDNLANVDDGELNRLQSILGGAATENAFNETLESLQPTVDGNHIAASINMAEEMRHHAQRRTKVLLRDNTRIKQVRPVKKKTTLVSGKKNLITGKVSNVSYKEKKKRNKVRIQEEKGAVWAVPFAKSMTQDEKDGLDGFSGSSVGVVVGADSGDMHDDILFGMSAIVGSSTIDSDNANRTETDITNYGVEAFGGVKVAKDTLLEGSLSYVHGNSKYKRKNIGSIAGNNATGNFASNHYNLHSRLSRRYEKDDRFTITPSVFLNYDSITGQEFIERGADIGGLKVEPGTVSTLEAGLGVELDWLYELESGSVVNPSAYAQYKYDIMSDQYKTTANFLASPDQRFVTKSYEPHKSQFNVGGSLDLEMSDNVELYSNYEFEYKDAYYDHTGQAGVTYKFN